MFDSVQCFYPLPGNPPPDVHTYEFQTKDLDCTLASYVITHQGELLLHETLCSYFTGTVVIYASNVVAHGVGVYTRNGDDAHYLEYSLKIVDGRVVEANETENRSQPALSSEKLRQIEREWDGQQSPSCKPKELAIGDTLYVLYGGRQVDEGYEIKVVNFNNKQIVGERLIKDQPTFELLWRSSYGTILFDDREQAQEHYDNRNRMVEFKRARYQELLQEQIASRTT